MLISLSSDSRKESMGKELVASAAASLSQHRGPNDSLNESHIAAEDMQIDAHLPGVRSRCQTALQHLCPAFMTTCVSHAVYKHLLRTNLGPS